MSSNATTPTGGCHTFSAGHDNASNFYRLAWSAAVDNASLRTFCLTCHSGTSPQVHSEGVTGYSGTNNWGSSGGAREFVCAACHDPHGDAAANNPDYMVHTKVWAAGTTSGLIPVTTGLGTEPEAGNMTFDLSGTPAGGDYVTDGGAVNKMCQVCHQGNEVFTRTSGTLAAHKGTQRCTDCHDHKEGFRSSCTSCHGGGLSGEGFGNWWPDSQAPNGTRWPNRNGGATPHTQHVTRIAEVVNATATPTTAQKNATCDWCHPTGQHTGDQAAAPADLMDGTTYVFKNISSAANLRTSTVTQGPGADSIWDDLPPSDDEVTCSNVDCHYTRTMGAADWYSPSYQSTCSYCHVPDNSNYVAGDLPNAHDRHVNGYNYICGWCHPIWGGTFDHQDGQVSLGWGYNPGPEAGDRFAAGGTGVPKFGGGAAGDYASCGGLTCHGDWDDPGIAFKGGNNYSPNWFNTAAQVGAGSSDGRCGTCHGDVAGVTDTAKAWPRSGSNSESHGEHLASNLSPTCSACHYDALGTNGTYGNPATHANRALTPIDIDNTYNYEAANASFEGTGNTCSNVRCHNGATTPNFALSGGVNITCGACHNGGTGAMDPRPSGDNVSRSHPAHADNNSVYTDCDNCHGDATYNVSGSRGGSAYTAMGGGGASPNGIHQNLSVEMWINGADNRYVDTANTAGGVNWNSAGATHVDDGTCSTTVCHGSEEPTWGGSIMSCSSCHSSTSADVDDFTWESFTGTVSNVNSTEWTSFGHAKANVSKGCMDCHSFSIGPRQRIELLPPRPGEVLREPRHLLQQHRGGVPHRDYLVQDRVRDQYGAQPHWDSFTPKCVDCHDPHGDGSNLHMIQSNLFDNGSTLAGVPNESNRGGVAIVFTNDTVGQTTTPQSTYADNQAGFDSLCQECHTINMIAYKDDTWANANSHPSAPGNPGDCTGCHKHSEAFKPSGCNGCHGSTATGQWWPDSTPSNGYPDRVGAHDNHVTAIYNANSGTLPGATIVEKKNATCDWCHPDPGSTSDVHRDPQNSGTHFKTIKGSPNGVATEMYNNGTAVGQKSCENVDCHYRVKTPSTGTSPNVGWYNASDQATCSTCHGSGTAGADLPNTYCHASGSYTTSHLDNQVSWSFAGTLDPGGTRTETYNGSATGTTSVKYGTGTFGTCANVYCHIKTSSPAWNTTIASNNCTDCHQTGQTAAPNPSSGLHYGTTAPTVSGKWHDNTLDSTNKCTVCHTTLLSQSTHVDGTFHGGAGQKTQMGLFAGYTQTADNQGTCSGSGVSGAGCHGIDPIDAGNWNRVWNSTVSYQTNGTECKGCHGGFATGDWTFGIADNTTDYQVSHERDWQGGDGAEVIGNHSGTTQAIRCNTCHVYGDAEYVWATYHRDRRITLNSTMGYNGTSYNCSTTCHDNNTGHNLEPASSDAWSTRGNTVAGPALACTGCHGATSPRAGVGTNSPHLRTVRGGANQDCAVCHTNHTGAVSIPNNSTVGINYADGGIGFGDRSGRNGSGNLLELPRPERGRGRGRCRGRLRVGHEHRRDLQLRNVPR
jgi:predicted CxxxxCH...CXXCH cytochrome family protein